MDGFIKYNEPRQMFIYRKLGDKKQSIYGFREADPRVMNYSKEMLIKRNCFVIF